MPNKISKKEGLTGSWGEEANHFMNGDWTDDTETSGDDEDEKGEAE